MSPKKPLFDIFSKRKSIFKKKPRQASKIIMDYREKNSLVYSQLLKSNLNVEIKNLKVADYLVGGVAIERKTVSDFIGSMTNKRLIKQLQEIQQYKKRLLIIEGIEDYELYDDSPEGMNGNAIRGFLLSITLKYNVPIIFTKNSEDTAKYISIISKKKDKEMSLNVSKKALNSKEQKQFILEGFPGIGPVTAKKLLKEFKSVKNILNASEEDLQKILGKKAEGFFKIVNENYYTVDNGSSK